MIEFWLPLYYKPGPEMGIEGQENFPPEILKEQGEFLVKELSQISDWLAILKKNSWSYCAGLYDVTCYKEITKEEAEAELKKLNIDIDPGSLMEQDDWE